VVTAPDPAGEQLPTERRLLLAAERLFAERGIDAVSVRAINAAAGANVAAVHYHFGSKEALLEALIHERSQEVSERRGVLLDRLEAGGVVTARGLAEAFAVPVAEMAASGGQAWVRFISGMINTRHPALEIVTHGFFDQARRFRALAERLHPDWSQSKALFRLSQSMNLTFRVLGDIPGVQATIAVAEHRIDEDEILEQLLDLLTTQLSDPGVSKKTRRA
jgi:AcrR family transcriptional regulator